MAITTQPAPVPTLSDNAGRRRRTNKHTKMRPSSPKKIAPEQQIQNTISVETRSKEVTPSNHEAVENKPQPKTFPFRLFFVELEKLTTEKELRDALHKLADENKYPQFSDERVKIEYRGPKVTGRACMWFETEEELQEFRDIVENYLVVRGKPLEVLDDNEMAIRIDEMRMERKAQREQEREKARQEREPQKTESLSGESNDGEEEEEEEEEEERPVSRSARKRRERRLRKKQQAAEKKASGEKEQEKEERERSVGAIRLTVLDNVGHSLDMVPLPLNPTLEELWVSLREVLRVSLVIKKGENFPLLKTRRGTVVKTDVGVRCLRDGDELVVVGYSTV